MFDFSNFVASKVSISIRVMMVNSIIICIVGVIEIPFLGSVMASSHLPSLLITYASGNHHFTIYMR
jgi:uncharacterized membrane protein YdjX (TVP38/TMEM64 family)